MSPEFLLYLGCEGHQDQGFLHCPGVENLIYSFYSNDEFLPQIIDYFTKVKLFDYPLRDFNSVVGFLSTFKERYQSKVKPPWTPAMFETYQKFCINHKRCPLYVRLGLPQEKK